MSIFVGIPPLVFGVFAISVLFLMTKGRRTTIKVCTALFAFAVIVGFSLYTYSYLVSDAEITDILFASLRGIYSTARMFFINDDFGVLGDTPGTQWLADNIWAQILLWLCYLSALVVIQATLFALFGRKLVERFRLRFGLHREVYIIKGGDKYALMLGENIVTHDNPHQRPDEKRLVVFLINEDEDERKTHEKAAHFDGVVKVIDRKKDLQYYLNKAGMGKRRCRKTKYNIILAPDNVSMHDNALAIAEYANKNKVENNKLDIYVFVSSEWDRKQIEAITRKGIKNSKRTYPYTFHIVSEVDLLIRQMIENHPPYKCRTLALKNGKATKNFTVMILGFGEIGEHALLRLVMNGQFVGSHMRAIIVEKNTEELKDCFLHRYPGIHLSCEMDFRNFDVQCKSFFNLLDEVADVDYIVIALNSSELNKQTALNVRLHYERKDVEKCPFIAISEKNGCSYEKRLEENIFVFGCREDIYKESVIIREEIDRMAKEVNVGYSVDNSNSITEWHELDWFSKESNRASADFMPAILKIAGIDEITEISKEIFAEFISTHLEFLAQTEHLRWNAFHVAMGWYPRSIEEMRRCFADTKDLELCRKNFTTKQHVCLTTWDGLDEVSTAYSQMAQEEFDFKEYDRSIIRSIPAYLYDLRAVVKPNALKKI